MDYQKIAGDVLFGGVVLDNAARGAFIEALAFDAVTRADEAKGIAKRWHHIGLGWGPWDLQRGTAASGDRVRFQLKSKALKQLWQREKIRLEYDLGLKNATEMPGYFARDWDPKLIGVCEPNGYRTDYFLFSWHEAGSQADPHTYRFFIVSVNAIKPTTVGPAKKLLLSTLLDSGSGCSFEELPSALNRAADEFCGAVEVTS